MRAALIILAFFLFAYDAKASSINDESFYPEGPLWFDGVLYYAEMPMHRIMAWDGKDNRVFWRQAGCGPTSIAPYGIDAKGSVGFIILCHYANKLVKINAAGETIGELIADQNGGGFINPNDSNADGRGGVYFSASGNFDKRAPQIGAVYYLPPEGSITLVALGLWYSNGVLVNREGTLLFVSEHLARRVLVFPIKHDGSLGEAQVFVDLDKLELKASDYDKAGPDGLEMDDKGNLYICEYGAGRVLVVDAQGKLLKVINWSQKYLTNIALIPELDAMALTGASNNSNHPFPGKVGLVPHPSP